MGKVRKLSESWQVIGVVKLLPPGGVRKLTFFPAPVDIRGLFLWGNIAIRCYYRKPGMKYGLLMEKEDAMRLFAKKQNGQWLPKAHIRYYLDDRDERSVPMTCMPVSRPSDTHQPDDIREIQKLIEQAEGRREGQVLPMIESFGKLHLRIEWDSRSRYTAKKWGQIGIGVFLTGIVNGHTKDRIVMISETNISAENMLKGGC